MTQPFGENATTKLTYYPFEEDISRKLYFQDIDHSVSRGKAPDFLETAKLDGIACHGLTMRTYAVGELTTRDLTAAALAGVGVKERKIVDLLGTPTPSFNAQRKLGGAAIGTNTVAPNLVGLSFWRGAFVPDQNAARKIRPTLKPLEAAYYRDDFVSIVTCIAKGMSYQQVGAEFGKPKSWADRVMFEFSARLNATAPELVLIVGGLGLLPQDEAPPDARSR